MVGARGGLVKLKSKLNSAKAKAEAKASSLGLAELGNIFLLHYFLSLSFKLLYSEHSEEASNMMNKYIFLLRQNNKYHAEWFKYKLDPQLLSDS